MKSQNQQSPAKIDIATDAEYWGDATTDEEAQSAADTLQEVLEEGARRLGINAEITQSPRGDGNKWRDDTEISSPAQEFLNNLYDFAWQHDAVQAAACTGTPVDTAQVLRDYNDSVVARGGQRRNQLD